MKKIILFLMIVMNGVLTADGYGFNIEEEKGYYEGESVYDEYGVNKETGQTREYEQRVKREQDTREYWNKKSNGEIPEDMTFDEYIYNRDHNIEINVQ